MYDDDDTPLDAIVIDEASGKIVTGAGQIVRVYKPYGQVEDSLKVRGTLRHNSRSLWQLIQIVVAAEHHKCRYHRRISPCIILGSH